MVSRLDGPSEKIVRRMIDDALAAEKQGLSGTAYFDARWPEPPAAPKGGYELYDASIHRAARIVSQSGRMPVKLDAAEKLFQPGDCPDAALYCGWYSLGNYVDAFTWKPGAVAYHIASSECATLKQKGGRVMRVPLSPPTTCTCSSSMMGTGTLNHKNRLYALARPRGPTPGRWPRSRGSCRRWACSRNTRRPCRRGSSRGLRLERYSVKPTERSASRPQTRSKMTVEMCAQAAFTAFQSCHRGARFLYSSSSVSSKS
jgi:hypothetical protein